MVGQNVYIQNSTTKRWDRTGVILTVLPHRKYKLILDHTRNITFRNRRFLKPNAGVYQHTPHISLSASSHPSKMATTSSVNLQGEEDREPHSINKHTFDNKQPPATITAETEPSLVQSDTEETNQQQPNTVTATGKEQL